MGRVQLTSGGEPPGGGPKGRGVHAAAVKRKAAPRHLAGAITRILAASGPLTGGQIAARLPGGGRGTRAALQLLMTDAVVEERAGRFHLAGVPRKG